MDNFKKIFPTKIKYCAEIDEALLNADICFIFTDWSQIKTISADKFKTLMKTPLVFDGRNCFRDIDNEIKYVSVGRPSLKGNMDTENSLSSEVRK